MEGWCPRRIFIRFPARVIHGNITVIPRQVSMKKFLFSLLLTLALASICRADSWTEDYTRLLAKYVTPNGVKYAAWHDNAGDHASLGKVVVAIAKEKPEGSKDEKLAFYLNAYNANILDQVLENYPIKSVRDIAFLYGIFTQQRITVSGEKMSFNHLEKDIIRGFGEPRMHFALNCASESCPPLRPQAYTGDGLSAELDQQTAAFLNVNPHGLKVTDDGKKADASKIFDWNAGDFQAADGVEGFINKYRQPPLAPDVKISYMSYDWSLNEAR